MKIALMVIYNHRFDKNIDRIDELYKNRFSNIFHVMPFYDGNRKNVLPIYGSSYHFQTYISQAYQQIKDKDFSHFFFIADDMIINPEINENNIFDITGIKKDECFIPGLITLQKRPDWERFMEAYRYNPHVSGVEISNILPSKEFAEEKFAKYSLSIDPVDKKIMLARIRENSRLKWLREFIRTKLHPEQEYVYKYPLVGGYSDILLVTKDVMPKFVKYCGAFAATNLFVEIAIPTAMVLAADNITTEERTKLKGKPLWVKEDFKILDPYKNDLQALLDNFPEGFMYLHPIKLSQWEK